ncbi:MAG: NAD kinase [Rhodobacteraceae bacterium]|nr:NAD kinase [Paracoccaceae bacterium]
MPHFRNIRFVSGDSAVATESRRQLIDIYGNSDEESADVIVALGGDGFMLQTLNRTRELDCPVYGMHRGTVGFLMNAYAEDNLHHRLEQAEEEVINPLAMRASDSSGSNCEALAINEVSLLRAGPQAIRVRISVDGKTRLPELVCDGVMVSTPAGSTAYNYSAHGPILPIGSDVLALTPVAAFRPRRWRGALLPKTARVTFEVLDPDSRPAMADADARSARDIVSVEIESEPKVRHRMLFDHGHGLQERLLREQFA